MFESLAIRDDNTGMSETPQPESQENVAGAVEEDRRTHDRRSSGELDRRSGVDRRGAKSEVSKLDRRRGPGRRRTDYRRDAEEGHMNEEQLEFIKAVDEYKRVNGRPFPTLTEVLDILLYLGYRKVAPVGEFKLCKGRQNPPR
ncbi:MAG: hypothetical protein D6744_13705 [Planctomycetota bacterium]|nr:MAG: hypothetical protein D6744_13705 [Planctomycetota bacterium]